MENYYNDTTDFVATKENIKDKLNAGFILIPIYYRITDEGQIMIDSHSMLTEFERTVYGIETVTDSVQE